jgi:phage shock protein A
LSKDRDDLAKAALVEKQKAADMGEQLVGEIKVIDEALQANEGDIAKLQAKLKEVRARQSSIVTRMESANNRVRMRQAYAGERMNEAFSRFDLLERRVDLAEARADVLAMGAPAKTLEEEIAELKSSDLVEAELAAMKAAMQKKD